MTASSTIWMALDLLRSPSGVKRLRTAPLPGDVNTLLQIAAGDEEASRRAAEATQRSPISIREAAAFYIEQILLHPDADHYRVLGARPEASAAELRRNMAWLVRWLHPDQQSGSERSVFVTRVTRAWSELKTDEKRAAYDLSRRRASAQKSKNLKSREAPQPSKSPRATRRGRARSPSQLHVSPGSRHPGIVMRVLLMFFGKALH